MKVKPYALSDILKMDYITFFDVLHEAEIEEQAAIDRAKQASEDGRKTGN